MSTTVSRPTPSSVVRDRGSACDAGLLGRYRAVTSAPELDWGRRYRKLRRLGRGGQGVVYLAQRAGADGFAVPVALKVFSPEPYHDARAYEEDMARTARAAARVAMIQHDNLVDIHDFVALDGVRLMEMEWLDGYDLRQLLGPAVLEQTRRRVPAEHYRHIDDVIVTPGPAQSRLKPGVAIQVLCDCLEALAALHREGIVHGDLKPSNILLKRAGNAKLIDIGSAVDLAAGPARRMWSPAYAAPEVLEGGGHTPRSDLASLGYVLVEMLAGRCPFDGLDGYAELIDAKRRLEERLPALLPAEVARNELLMGLCRRLVARDPSRRFATAQAADLGRRGAADFHRQLVKGDLAREYGNDLRVWLEALREPVAGPAQG